MGEGAGILLLEEYDHAKARGAKIYAEIRGYGNTCDAYHVTAPHPESVSAAQAISLALEEAGISAEGAGAVYINAHGTSTPLNDKAETLAIKTAFGAHAGKVMVSSTKSMTGICWARRRGGSHRERKSRAGGRYPPNNRL